MTLQTVAQRRTMELPDLSDVHIAHLKASNISDEVIKERSYMTITRKNQLKDCGFNKSQSRVPGILMPLWSVNGDVYSYQYKPDSPRTNSEWKPIKYENVPEVPVRIDVPPRCRGKLQDPDEPLFITEGVKKVDSLATTGVCAIGLTGVWNFKGTNLMGGTTLLADWDYIALKDRVTYIVYDSDVSIKTQVRKALDRLKEHLSRKGAKVRILQLPDSPEGHKLGVDDYLALDHTVDELIALEVMDVKAVEEAAEFHSDSQYKIENGVICWEHTVKEGKITTPLCDFNAHIHQYVVKDDGQDLENYYRIMGTTYKGSPLPAVDIKTEEFSSLKWIDKYWGLDAIVWPGQNIKERLVHAIKLQSVQSVNKLQVYTHMGWREIDGKKVYLSGGGGIGPEGPVDVDVEMEDPLKGYILLRPEGDRAEAFSISKDFLLIGDLPVTIPLWTAMYLAPLSEYIDTAFSLWLIAGSSSFKSTISALALCHFGTFTHLTLPAGWDATKNDLEKLLFLAKDAPLVIDDLYPGEDSSETRRLAQTAIKITRAQGNRQARGRMRADRSLESGYRPRGLLLSSGEHAPGGHSQNSRIIAINMSRSDINSDYMKGAQDEHPLYYNRSMAHYLQWLSSNWDPLKEEFKDVWRGQRDKYFSDKRHARLSTDIASLYTGLYAATRFGVDIGAISDKEAEVLRDDGEVIFAGMIEEQSDIVENLRPAKRFISVLSSMISLGRVSFDNINTTLSPHPEPGIYPVGWHDGNGTYFLEPEGAYLAVTKFCQDSNQPFTFYPDAVWKDMKLQGISIDHDNQRTKSNVWIPSLGRQERVIKLKKQTFESLFQVNN